ncbi:carbohydrate ABC transporter permease [Halonatronum saccharophilum]|uniref:carbohydrate ABC transporter permease n=1 Tax=Halonatronum saccharophilum TaxID=150060 RepID=UPI000485073A|nr:sugar ABC transporter permease [Halonatronum saccharophilum]
MKKILGQDENPLSNFFKQYGFSYAMLLPALIVVALVIIYPFFYNFRLAFSNLNMYRMRPFIREGILETSFQIGMQNFVRILSSSDFWIVFLRTIVWTIINVFSHVSFGIFFAILLNRDMKFKGIYRTLLMIPWAIPQYIVILIWRGMFNYRYGAVNNFLGLFGIERISWLTTPAGGFSASIITNVWLGIPFMMMIALGGLQSINPTFYEAADIDGASNLQKIKHITLPLLKPVMTPAIVLGVIWTFNNLNVIYMMTAQTLTDQIDILVIYVYRAAFEFYRYGYAAAFSVIIFLILLVWGLTFMEYMSDEEKAVR